MRDSLSYLDNLLIYTVYVMIPLAVSDPFACPVGVLTNLGIDEEGSRASAQKQQKHTRR